MPATLVLICRCVLILVFAAAAIGKLMDMAGSRAAVEGFGLPRPVAAVVGTLLPVAELAVAVLLLLDGTARAGAIGAAVLLAGFVVGISRLLARGQEAECHCFGAIHSAPVSWRTLARNVALLAVAGLVVAGGRPGRLSNWIASLHGVRALAAAEGLALALVVLGAALFGFSLLRRHGALLLRIDELESRLQDGGGALPARQAPDFALSGLYGETVTLQSLLAPGLPLLLLFTDPGCGPCAALMPEVVRWQADHAGKLAIALVSGGTIEDNRSKAGEHGLGNVYVQDGRSVSEAYGVNGTPSGVLIRPGGAIVDPVGAGADAIRALVSTALSGTAQPAPPMQVIPPAPPVPALAGVPVGSPAPRRQLVDLRSRKVDLAGGRGDTLVVFWNPQCGFCERLEDELVAWEQGRGRDDPQLVLISAGPEEENRRLPFKGPVVHDPTSELMNQFAAPGTPSALMIDADGRVASEIAVGGPAVMELAGSPSRA